MTAKILYADELNENRTWNDYEHVGLRVNDIAYQPKELRLPDPQSSYHALQQNVEQKMAGKSGEYLARLPIETYYNQGVKNDAGGLEPKASEEYVLFLYSVKRSSLLELQRARRYVIEKLFLETEDLLGSDPMG